MLAGGILEVENVKAGAWETEREKEGEFWGGLCSLGSDVKHPGEMFVILMGYHHGNSF